MTRFGIIHAIWHEHLFARRPDDVYRLLGLIGTTLELLLIGETDDMPSNIEYNTAIRNDG